MFSIVCLVWACANLPTTKDQKAAVDTTCMLVDAFASTPEEQAICATADDLLALEGLVRAARADAGPTVARKSNPCKIIGSLCASESELAAAIKSRKASK